jgi:lysozyme
MTALELIKKFEGFSKTPYMCPTGYWTIGYGHIIKMHGKALAGENNKWNAYEIVEEMPEGFASRLLQREIEVIQGDILQWVKVKLTDNQLSALTSFVFNVGISNFINSTLLKRLNAGHYDAIPAELKKWVKGTINGKKITIQGLVNRRRAEAELWSIMVL